MGQTLENGVYLPSEGERNCYAGLKTNWEILDQKVADVTALQQAVAGALHREIVESLPTTDIDPNTIYMILSGTSATENVYNEFMYVNNAWELIGTSATDLTNYYTKSEVDGKLLLKASASDLTSHTGDTTIHVTASDKTKWNNGVSQSYVLRYSSSSVTDNSTIAYSTLDNTDNIKASDKIIDSDGKIFSIVSVDTANQTVTVGTALIDLANDSDVVHKSGDETISGEKTFNDLQIISYGTQYKGARNAYILPEFSAGYSGLSITTMGFAQALKIGNFVLDANNKPSLDTSKAYIQLSTGESNGVNACLLESRNSTSSSLGTSANKWSKIYGTEYYYGASNVEFSTKFVTTDTDQMVSGQKLFSDINAISSSSEIGVSGGNRSYKVLDKNKKILARLEGGTFSSGMAYSYWLINNGSDGFNGVFLYQPSASLAQLRPYDSTLSVQLGASNRYFSDCYTSKINGLNPSSLSLPSGNVSDVIDISSYISDLSGTVNLYTPPANGYLTFTFSNGSQVQIYPTTGAGSASKWIAGSGSGIIRGFIPVLKNIEMKISVSATTMDSFYFIPCQGNV